MTQDQQPLTAHRVIAARVKDLRKRRGWSAQRLGEEMTAAGIAWDRSIVANFENGRRPYVTVEELLALAYVLSVAPVHMIVPPLSGQELMPPDVYHFGEAPYFFAITPTTKYAPTGAVRGWIRGQRTIGTVDPRLYFSEVPPGEFTMELRPDDEVTEMVERWMRDEEEAVRTQAAGRDDGSPTELGLADASVPIEEEEEGKRNDRSD